MPLILRFSMILCSLSPFRFKNDIVLDVEFLSAWSAPKGWGGEAMCSKL